MKIFKLKYIKSIKKYWGASLKFKAEEYNIKIVDIYNHLSEFYLVKLINGKFWFRCEFSNKEDLNKYIYLIIYPNNKKIECSTHIRNYQVGFAPNNLNYIKL